MFYFIQIYPLLFTCAFNAGQPPGTLQFRVQVASEGGGEATNSNLLTIYLLTLVFDLYIYMLKKISYYCSIFQTQRTRDFVF